MRLLLLLLLGLHQTPDNAAPATEEVAVPELRTANLITNSLFQAGGEGKGPEGFETLGDVAFGVLGDSTKENNGRGFRLVAGQDLNADGQHEGSVAVTVANLGKNDGRWFRFRVRALAQEDFVMEQDDLFLNAEFFRDQGTNALDHIKRSIYAAVERDRQKLADSGTNKSLGPAVWRSFDLEFRTPFPEVDAVRLTVGFGHGKGGGTRAEFWINELELTPIPVPADYVPPAGKAISLGSEAIAAMVPLGGRWYYDPRGGERTPPAEFTAANADRLWYSAGRLEAPFANNMTAWLRKGYLTVEGKVATEDVDVPDNLTVSFTATHLVMRSKGLPNHPTTVFPDRERYLDGNPNYIQEQRSITALPLEPRENPAHVAMKDASNNNHALPGGPIGIAVNGVVFFNPFDHLLDADAVWRLDRCCGHPSPRALYHYHKYPVCVKSPWADDGAEHSPLIGFAYDGYPVFGPYEEKGVLAKDDDQHPLNEFNGHYDETRGWHYHATPGKFPHLLGGFWGFVEDRRR